MRFGTAGNYVARSVYRPSAPDLTEPEANYMKGDLPMRPASCLFFVSLSLLIVTPEAVLTQSAGASATAELLLVEEDLTAEKVEVLRSRGLQPFTRDVEALTKGLAAHNSGELLPSSAARISSLLIPSPGLEPSPAEVQLALENLNPTGLPKSFFEELSKALTAEELATVLREAEGFEISDPQEIEELLSTMEATELFSQLADWNRDKGQVVEGTQVPSKLPIPIDLTDLANKPAVWGLNIGVESIEACSSVAADFNRALEEAAVKQFDIEAQLRKVALGRKVDSTCFRSVPAPAPMEVEAFGLLEYPGGKLNCAAVMTSSTTIVTARHCLYNDQTGGPQVIKWSFIRFRPWLDPGKRVPLQTVRIPETAPASSNDQFQAIYDVAEATLQEAIDGAPRVCWAGVTSPGEPLGLFGHLPEATAPIESEWPARLRISAGGTCVAQESSDTCFVHFCNAVPGFSGSPLFGLRDSSCPDGVRVLGLHLAASGKSRGCATLGGNDAVAGSQVAKLLNLLP